MPRKANYPLSLESLEDRCVLSGSPLPTPLPTLAVPAVSPTDPQAYLAQIQQQVQAITQQAQTQGQLEVTRAESVVQSSTSQSASGTTALPSAHAVGTPATQPTTTNNVGATTPSVPQGTIPTQTVASVPSGASTESAQTGATNFNAANVPQTTAAASASTASHVTASGSEGDTGLTAVPPAGNAASANGGANAQTASLATTGTATAATLTAEGAGSGTAQVGVAQPQGGSNLFGNAPLPGQPDLSGNGIRTYPYGATQSLSRDALVISAVTSPEEAALAVAGPALMGADLLNGAAPQDGAALDLGVRRFIDQLNDLGGGLRETLQETSPTLWVAAVALGLATLEVVRRRRARRASGQAGGVLGLADSWVPGLSGPLGSEQS